MLALTGKDLGGDFFQTAYGIYIYTGALMGTLMFLNVWLIIWPNQQILMSNAATVLGGGAPNPEAAKAAPKALLASRTNVLFSIPLLFFMGACRHLSLEIPEGFSPVAVISVVTGLIFLLEVNAIKGKLGPLATPKGVIHCGLGLLVALYVFIEVIV
jgi:uncharacterized membrane protein